MESDKEKSNGVRKFVEDYAKNLAAGGLLAATNKGTFDQSGKAVTYKQLYESGALSKDMAQKALSGQQMYWAGDKIVDMGSGISRDNVTGKVTVYVPNNVLNKSDRVKELLNSDSFKNTMAAYSMNPNAKYTSADGAEHDISEAIQDYNDYIKNISSSYHDIEHARETLNSDFGLDNVTDEEAITSLMGVSSDAKDSDAITVPLATFGLKDFDKISSLSSYNAESNTISYGDFKKLMSELDSGTRGAWIKTLSQYFANIKTTGEREVRDDDGKIRTAPGYNVTDDEARDRKDVINGLSFYRSLMSTDSNETFMDGVATTVEGVSVNALTTFTDVWANVAWHGQQLLMAAPLLIATTGSSVIDIASGVNPLSEGSNTVNMWLDAYRDTPNFGKEVKTITEAINAGKNYYWDNDTKRFVVEEGKETEIASLGGVFVDPTFGEATFLNSANRDLHAQTYMNAAVIGKTIGGVAAVITTQKGLYDPFGKMFETGIIAKFGEAGVSAVKMGKIAQKTTRVVAAGVGTYLSAKSIIEQAQNNNPAGALVSGMIGVPLVLGNLAGGSADRTWIAEGAMMANVFMQSVFETAMDDSNAFESIYKNGVYNPETKQWNTPLIEAFGQNFLWNWVGERSGLGKSTVGEINNLASSDAISRGAIKATNAIATARYKINQIKSEALAKMFKGIDAKDPKAAEVRQFYGKEAKASWDVVTSKGVEEFQSSIMNKINLELSFANKNGNLAKAEGIAANRENFDEFVNGFNRMQAVLNKQGVNTQKAYINEGRSMPQEVADYFGTKIDMDYWRNTEGEQGKNYLALVDRFNSLQSQVEATYGSEMIAAVSDTIESGRKFYKGYHDFFAGPNGTVDDEAYRGQIESGRWGADGSEYWHIIRLVDASDAGRAEAFENIRTSVENATNMESFRSNIKEYKRADYANTEMHYADPIMTMIADVDALARVKGATDFFEAVRSVDDTGMVRRGTVKELEAKRGITHQNIVNIMDAMKSKVGGTVQEAVSQEGIFANEHAAYTAFTKTKSGLAEQKAQVEKAKSTIYNNNAATADEFIGQLTYAACKEMGVAEELGLTEYTPVKTNAQLQEIYSSLNAKQQSYLDSRLRDFGIDTVSRMNERASAATLPQNARRATFEEVTTGKDYAPTNKDFGKTAISKAKKSGEVKVYYVSGDGSLENGKRVYTSKAQAEAIAKDAGPMTSRKKNTKSFEEYDIEHKTKQADSKLKPLETKYNNAKAKADNAEAMQKDLISQWSKKVDDAREAVKKEIIPVVDKRIESDIHWKQRAVEAHESRYKDHMKESKEWERLGDADEAKLEKSKALEASKQSRKIRLEIKELEAKKGKSLSDEELETWLADRSNNGKIDQDKRAAYTNAKKELRKAQKGADVTKKSAAAHAAWETLEKYRSSLERYKKGEMSSGEQLDFEIDNDIKPLPYSVYSKKTSSVRQRTVKEVTRKTSEIAWEDDTGGYINKPLSKSALLEAGYGKGIVDSAQSVKFWNLLFKYDPDFGQQMFTRQIAGEKKTKLKKTDAFKSSIVSFNESRILGDELIKYNDYISQLENLSKELEAADEDVKNIWGQGELAFDENINIRHGINVQMQYLSDSIVAGTANRAVDMNDPMTKAIVEELTKYGVSADEAKRYLACRAILDSSTKGDSYDKKYAQSKTIEAKNVDAELTGGEKMKSDGLNILARSVTAMAEKQKFKVTKNQKDGSKVTIDKKFDTKQVQTYSRVTYNYVKDIIQSEVNRVDALLKENGGEHLIDMEAYTKQLKAETRAILKGTGVKEDTDHKVIVTRNGVKEEWIINDDVYTLLSNKYSTQQPGLVARISKAAQRIFRRGTTGAFAPASWMNQWIKDSVQLFITSGAVAFKDGGMSKFLGDGVTQRIGDEFVDEFAPKFIEYIKNDMPEGTFEKVEQQAKTAGMSVERYAAEMFTTRKVEALFGDVESATEFWTKDGYKARRNFNNTIYGRNSLKGKKSSDIADMGRNIFEKLSDTASKFSTNQARESYYRSVAYNKTLASALRNGASVQDAQKYAELYMRTATTDFSRSFGFGNNIIKSIPYLSAALNGKASFLRLAEIDPVGISQRVGMMALSYMQVLTASLANEQNREEYKKLSEYQKDGQLVWVENGVAFTIPVPEEVAMLLNPIRQGIEKSYDANDNTFWQLAVSDVLDLSAYELSGFADLDRNTIYNEQDMFERMSTGAMRLMSQISTPAVKTAFMLATGIDPYTGRDIDNSYITYDDVTGEITKVDNEQGVLANAFSDFVKSLGGDLSASAASKILSALLGSSGSKNIEGVTSILTGKFDQGAETIVNRALSPLTAEIYDEARNDRNAFIKNMYALKDSMMSPDSDTGKEIARLRQAMSTASTNQDEEAYNKAYGQIKTIMQDYTEKVLDGVNKLQQKHGDVFFTKNFQASVISLLTFDTGSQFVPYSAVGARDESKQAYFQARNMAVQSMVDAGFPDITKGKDLSIFGYGYYKSNGEYKYTFANPLTIMALDNAETSYSRISNDKIQYAMESTGLKTELKELNDTVGEMYDEARAKNYSSKQYTELRKQIDNMYYAYDKKVFSQVLIPVFDEMQEAGISVEEFIDFNLDDFDNIVRVPNAYMGRGKYDKKVQQQKAYVKSYIKSVYSGYIKQVKGSSK